MQAISEPAGVTGTGSGLSTLPAWLFLITLLLAPQLWWSPMLGWRVDFFVYPFWLLVLVLSGRISALFRLRAQDGFFVAWLCWILVSIAANGWNDLSGEQIFRHVRYFVLYRFLAATIAHEKDLRRVAVALLACALVVAVEGIQHMHSSDGLGWAGQPFGWVDPAAAEIGLGARTQWVGIFDGPGVFCTIFTIALPFALMYASAPYSSSFIARILAFGLLATPLLLAAYYTGARGGILATAAALGAFALSRFGIRLRHLMAFGALGLAVYAALPSYLTATKDSNKSAQNRIKMWAASYEMVQSNPVFGVGKGNFARHTGFLVAHNSALEVMAELGFPGFFAWLGLIYFGFKTLITRAGELAAAGAAGRRERQVLIAIGISLFAYLVSSLFVTLETDLQYFLLGMCAAVGAWAKVRVSWRDFLSVGLIMLSYYAAVKLFVMNYW